MNRRPNIQNWPRKEKSAFTEAFMKLHPAEQRVILREIANALKKAVESRRSCERTH
jgi:hypothetical protein